MKPPAIVATCPTPALVYDLARVEANLRAIAAAARAHGIVPLFAAKSFPHPEVWRLAAEIVDGFDVASIGEAVPRAKVVSIADPTGRHVDAPCERLIVSCETPAQAARAPARADIAIRVSASITGTDPAIGAVQDGSGHRRSRFGLEDNLRAIADAAGTRRVGLHVHHGSIVATSPERFVTTMRAALALADAAGLAPAFLDLGGAWHAVDIAATFAALRAATDLELIVEPGRAYAAGAGFAVGTVTAARELARSGFAGPRSNAERCADMIDRPLRVLDLSRVCHLRWSQPELIATPPAPRAGRAILWAGPTCYEDDVLGEWIADPLHFPAGARVVLGNVSGYALAWNTGFGGIPPAHAIT